MEWIRGEPPGPQIPSIFYRDLLFFQGLSGSLPKMAQIFLKLLASGSPDACWLLAPQMLKFRFQLRKLRKKNDLQPDSETWLQEWGNGICKLFLWNHVMNLSWFTQIGKLREWMKHRKVEEHTDQKQETCWATSEISSEHSGTTSAENIGKPQTKNKKHVEQPLQ